MKRKEIKRQLAELSKVLESELNLFSTSLEINGLEFVNKIHTQVELLRRGV